LQPNGYAVYVGGKDMVWLSDFAANAAFCNQSVQRTHIKWNPDQIHKRIL
jgi:streptogramin lyase